MTTVMDIFDLAKTLSESDRARLTDLIANTIAKNKNKNEVLTEKRFSDGIFCPRCNNLTLKETVIKELYRDICVWIVTRLSQSQQTQSLLQQRKICQYGRSMLNV